MTNRKLDAFNVFIRAVVRLGEHHETASEAGGPEGQGAFMRRETQLRLEVIRAAFAQSDVASNPEADKIIGEVLLERIESAISIRSKVGWEDLAQAALADLEGTVEELSPAVKDWLDSSQPVVILAGEARARGEEQYLETMMEGFRRGAAQTADSHLQITEIEGDTVVRDEHVFGPTAGEEDSPHRRVNTLSLSDQQIFGLDDDRTRAAVERVCITQGKTITGRLGESNPSSEALRLLVARHALDEAYRDLSISEVIADLPTPIGGLSTEHLPALRGQLLNMQALLLTEGSTYSRIQRGDTSAWKMMLQIIFSAGMLAFADPYFLPLDQIPKGSQAGSGIRELPAEQTFLVWHDNAATISDDVHAIAWVFSTDGNGQIEEVAHMARLHNDNSLDFSWVSLRAGLVAETARAVASTLTTRTWEKAKRLRLPPDPDNAKWTRMLLSSRGRARRGGAHGLHTLAG